MSDKVYGYIRVSTDTQSEKGYGLQTQEAAIVDYCHKHNLELVELFRDEGITGKAIDAEVLEDSLSHRPGLAELLAMLKAGEIKTVVVLNTSRLWRDDTSKMLIKRSILKANANVISIEQPHYSIAEREPNDFLFNAIMEALDHWDRMNITIKLAHGRRTKAKDGYKPAGEAPIGYKWEHQEGKPIVVVDPDNADLVRYIFKKYLETKSTRKVMKLLEQEGHKTKRGKNFSAMSIGNILNNEFYKGIITHGDVTRKGQHESIINPVTFGKVQALLHMNRKQPSGGTT
jgi:site-specific DNA recombinase